MSLSSIIYSLIVSFVEKRRVAHSSSCLHLPVLVFTEALEDTCLRGKSAEDDGTDNKASLVSAGLVVHTRLLYALYLLLAAALTYRPHCAKRA
jgi:hypothetical protein